MKRRYPENPIIAVGACLFNGDKILIVRRNKPPSKGKWSLPGGVVELGESLREAIKREIKEELGVEMKIGGLLGVFERIKRDAQNRVEYHYVLVDFWGWISEGDILLNDEIQEVRWFNMEETEYLLQDTTLIAHIRDALKKYLQK